MPAAIAERLNAFDLPPGPKGRPFLGSVIELRRDLLGFMSRAARDYGDVVSFRLFHVRVCLLSDPDAIEQVLVRNYGRFIKSRDYRALAAVLGDGLLTTEHEVWRRQRRLIQPVFHRENVLVYADTMVECARQAIAGWRDGAMMDVHDEMAQLTLQIVARCLFGADVTAQAREVREAMHVATSQFTNYARLAMVLPKRFLIPRVSKMGRAVRKLDRVLYGIIRERRAAHQAGQTHGPRDLLGLLLSARDEEGRAMDDSELRDQAMTLFLAGHETTALALTWTWYLLSQNPVVEEMLLAELRSVLAGRDPAPGDLPSLPYLDCVLKESLRLYPPVWGIGREAVKAFDAGGYHLPAGTKVFISPWVMHRNERFFPDPERFDPDRWRDDPVRRGVLPRFAYFPFGGGPRVCIGAGFAQMETALLLATIAQHFRISLVADHPVKLLPSVTLRPKFGIRATVHRR